VRPTRLGTSAAAFALVLTAGCGAGGGDGSGTASEGLTKANFASEVSQAQAEAETAHLDANMNVQGQQLQMTGDMDMSRRDAAFDLTMSGGALGGNARFILVDRVIYLKVPGLTRNDKFIKIDAAAGGGPMAEMFNRMLGQLDPSKTFDAFDAVTQLQEKGTQEIDGEETTRYAVTVDTRKALQAQGMAGQVPQGQVPETITYDVWVDGENLVRKLRMDIPGPGQGAQALGEVDMTLSEWGEPVDVSAPPAGQTTDMGQMMGQMEGSGPSTG
jgi:lipoprotein LprG